MAARAIFERGKAVVAEFELPVGRDQPLELVPGNAIAFRLGPIAAARDVSVVGDAFNAP